ncbi:aminopeptidase N [Zerene cesonia]|uniref:aminopeptidase N n=1 Tax=Zerene cesonia TaxID=33412 RepID=UPI0018E54B6C|nr:aminopeptidase N [Zerene cesonia]
MFRKMKSIGGLIAACAYLCYANSLPPDKDQNVQGLHIIKTRSIDLNNAHALTLEARLEKTIEPTGYHLDIEPYLEDALFKGHVRINVTWLQDSDEISVHCDHDLEITNYEVYIEESGKMEKVTIKKMRMDIKKPILTLRLDKTVSKLTIGYLDFSFKGNLQTTSTDGFFTSTYKTEIDEERIVAGTQLRPNNARRMFPCFDEPGYKTPFELTVVRPRDMIALSNTPVAKTENITDEPGAVKDYFERTPPMSTFTLGIVIAHLKQLGGSTHYKDDNGNNIELRVWARPEFLPALEGLHEKVPRVFAEIANFWQVPLPLKRLDIVALPNYLGVKPVDNWGLIVFKESDLTNRRYLQLEQEITYHWLGALTTPAWWSDAYVNKGLVGYIAAEIALKLNDTEIERQWPLTVLYSIYYEFSKRYPHSRITGMKQETACTKIELLFRLFNYTLGADTFRKGLRKFIKEKRMKTFTSDDVWNALNDAAREDGKIAKDVDIKMIAASWIEKDRLPLVTVTRNYDKNTAHVSQKVYLRERPHDVPNADKMTWQLPLVVIRGDKLDFANTAPVAWMQEKEIILDNMPGKQHFIIVNPEEIAPFPVNYEKDNWNLLLQFLQSDQRVAIPSLTRAKILHDAWNLAYAGELSFVTALNMTLFLKNEKDYMVWEPVFTMIDHIGRHICSCIADKFRAYVRTFLSPLYNELKIEKENEEAGRKNLRSLTKSFLCKAGYKPCIQEAQEAYDKWMQAPNPDDGNPIPNQFICPVFKWGSQKEWEFGLQRVINFPSSRKQSERTYLLKTLAGCPIEEYKINRLLNITILEGNGNFTETDLFLIFSMLTGGSEGYTTLFHFLENNFDFLKEKFSSKTNLWDNLISSATGEFTTQAGLDLVSRLYVAHQGEFGSAEHIIEKSMRNIREEVKWSSENIPVIEQWLDDYKQMSDVKDDQFIKN